MRDGQRDADLRRIFGAAYADPAGRSALLDSVYGGTHPKTSRVFYSDFSDDPWLEASVRQSFPDEDQWYDVAECDGCGHCMDFHAPAPSDPEALVKLRQHFDAHLAEWLGATAEVVV